MKFIPLILLLFSPLISRAQEPLSLEQAIEQALEQNYSVKIAKSHLHIDKNNARDLTMNLLPSLSANAGAGENLANTKQTFNTGITQDRQNARSTSLNGAIALNWTIFDGMKMFATNDKFREFEKLGETNLRAQLLQTVNEVTQTYYSLVTMRHQTGTLMEALALSARRVKDVSNKYTIGRSSKLDVLTAKVDYNEDTTALIRQRQTVLATRIRLNQLLARDPGHQFQVMDTILLDRSLQYEPMKQLTVANNPIVQAHKINESIAALTYKEVRGNRYPLVQLNGGYNYLKSTAGFGQVIDNRNQNWAYGATASVPLFNGFRQRKQEQNAKTEVETSVLQTAQVNQDLEAQLNTAFMNYQNSIALVSVESDNRDVARENMDITYEKYRLGSITALELRQAQQNYLEADFRYISAQYDAKTAETSIKLLAGTLIN